MITLSFILENFIRIVWKVMEKEEFTSSSGIQSMRYWEEVSTWKGRAFVVTTHDKPDITGDLGLIHRNCRLLTSKLFLVVL